MASLRSSSTLQFAGSGENGDHRSGLRKGGGPLSGAGRRAGPNEFSRRQPSIGRLMAQSDDEVAGAASHARAFLSTS